jgi:predicted small lipoprotein YifL
MQRLILVIFATASLFLLISCGQSGPLYLPGNPSRMETLPPAPVGSEQDEEKAKEKTDSPSG